MTDQSMTEEVVVTRKEQTTIPAKLRAKYKIRRGTKLERFLIATKGYHSSQELLFAKLQIGLKGSVC